ncbi:methyl-accepting chemotaxis protein [Sphingomonas sp. PAMC 26605]|uniref:methyl-accepting chemotaxis protein n=1 Tax=Sphingomonas sp. PAMC 26605 TaxID=1112214 RepID=UPI00026CA6F4|nr:methyl-accepting chemotaxis protein [Sphingomonas sp. PAMC 26605]
MLHWFEAVAPIRRKMLVVAGTSTSICLFTSGLAIALGGYGAILATLVGASLCFGLNLIFRERICTPYVNTVVRMEGLAAGDLSSDIVYTDYKDCVGRMTKAMFTFRDTARRQLEMEIMQESVVALLNTHLGHLAAGDLTATIDQPVAQEYASLTHNFNGAVQALSRLIGQIGAATNGITSSSVKIAEASDALARRTHNSAASVEETTASLTTMDARINASGKAALDTVERVHEARKIVMTGHDQVTMAVEAMAKVADSAKAIDAVIEGLDKIAFQTRVLAMNAAVESGHAGEAGRGFAVVADLVSQLASRSEEEARRAREQISETQERIMASVKQVQNMNGALDHISSSVASVEELVNQIANDNATQASAVSQILVAIGDIDKAIQQNAAMVEETSASAKALDAEIQTLQRHASAFTVETVVDAPKSFAPQRERNLVAA